MRMVCRWFVIAPASHLSELVKSELTGASFDAQGMGMKFVKVWNERRAARGADKIEERDD